MNINSEKKNNTNRDRASNNGFSNVEISYRSTMKMFLETSRSKRNAYTKCKTIKSAAPAIRPPGIQNYENEDISNRKKYQQRQKLNQQY